MGRFSRETRIKILGIEYSRSDGNRWPQFFIGRPLPRFSICETMIGTTIPTFWANSRNGKTDHFWRCVRFLKLSNMEIFGTLLFGSFPRNYGGPWWTWHILKMKSVLPSDMSGFICHYQRKFSWETSDRRTTSQRQRIVEQKNSRVK